MSDINQTIMFNFNIPKDIFHDSTLILKGSVNRVTLDVVGNFFHLQFILRPPFSAT